MGSVGSLAFWRIVVLDAGGVISDSETVVFGVGSLACGAEGVLGEEGGRTVIVIVVGAWFIGGVCGLTEVSSSCFFCLGGGVGDEHLGSSAKTLEVAYQYTTPPARAHLTAPDLNLDFFGAAVLRNLAALVKAGRANDGRNGEWRRRTLPAGRNMFVCGEGKPGGIQSGARIGGLLGVRLGVSAERDGELKNFILRPHRHVMHSISKHRHT